MKFSSYENISKQDEKKYMLDNNTEFNTWYSEVCSSNYKSFISPFELQDMIDIISEWYEIKYPTNNFINCNGTSNPDIYGTSNRVQCMDFNSLINKLTAKQILLLNCNYRAKYNGEEAIVNRMNNVVGYMSKILFVLSNDQDHSIDIIANSSDGVIDGDFSTFSSQNYQLTLNDLVNNLKHSNPNNYNYQEISNCIINHNIDLELRKKVLSFVSLKLLYSKEYNPNYNYIRASKFIAEFNKYIPNLNLSTDEIDNIMNNQFYNYETSDTKKLTILLKKQ